MCECIQVDGQKVFISIDSLSLELNKIKKNQFGQLLYNISLAINELNINLCLLLPIVKIPNKNYMINKLRETTFNCIINGNYRTININKIAVLSEGYYGYYSFYECEDTLVIDIGSGIINFAAFCNGKLAESFTKKISYV